VRFVNDVLLPAASRLSEQRACVVRLGSDQPHH
jgi:hypothetical protein